MNHFIGTYDYLSGKGLDSEANGPIRVESSSLSSTDENELGPYVIRGKLRRFGRHCGFLKFQTKKGPILLEVLPKAWEGNQASDASFDRWMMVFNKLIDDNLIIQPSEKDRFLNLVNLGNRTQVTSVLELFLIATLDEVYSGLKRGVPKESEKKVDQSVAIRGRIVWSQNIQKMLGLGHRHIVQYNDLSHSDKISAFLKSAILWISRNFSDVLVSEESKKLLRQLSRLTHDFSEIDLRACKQTITEFSKFPTPRMAHLRPGVASLAKWIYGIEADQDESLLTYSQSGFSINLEKVFENWCRKELGEAVKILGSNLGCTTGSDEQWLWGHYQRPNLPQLTGKLIKPDLVLYDITGGIRDIKIIGDAKYKNLNPNGVDFEGETPCETEIDRNDVFQLFTYRAAIGSGPKSLITVQGRSPITFSRTFSSTGPKIVIFVPGDAYSCGDGFRADQFDHDWTLKLVKLPFNSYLRSEASYKKGLLEFIDDIVKPELHVSKAG